MLTNIYQCSKESEERAWAQAINMFLQSEKLHIMSKRSEHSDRSCYFEPKIDVSIFEPYSCESGDLYRIVFITNTKEVEKFPNVLFLYRRALRLLLQEPRSITYNVYHRTNGKEKDAIDLFLLM